MLVKKNHIFKVILILYLLTFCINNINAVQIKSNNTVDVNKKITITLDFGQYVAAYDSIVVEYNRNVLEYVSGDPLIENLWWDSTDESKGINTKTYTFNAKRDGTCNIKIKVKGLVSANKTLDVLGDIEVSKEIKVGTGILKGDLDKNGEIDTADAAVALNLFKYKNYSKEDMQIGDMDNNGVIDTADAAEILNIFKYN